MTCNKITKPEFTKEFIVKNCGTIENPLCKHASGKIKFCQLFGIIGKKEIIYPSKTTMAKSLITAGVKHITSGMKERSQEEQKKCMKICNACDRFVKDTERCMACGCKMKRKIKWKTTNCILRKW